MIKFTIQSLVSSRVSEGDTKPYINHLFGFLGTQPSLSLLAWCVSGSLHFRTNDFLTDNKTMVILLAENYVLSGKFVITCLINTFDVNISNRFGYEISKGSPNSRATFSSIHSFTAVKGNTKKATVLRKYACQTHRRHGASNKASTVHKCQGQRA